MKCNEKGLALIRDSEGLRLTSYKCPAGVWTIGHGHTGPDVGPGNKISEETAERLLLKDVAIAEQGVRNLVRVPLNENQFSALVSFIFNLGETKIRNTTTILVLNKGDYQDFAKRLLLWTKSRGIELSGLVSRRQKEKALFLEPV